MLNTNLGLNGMTNFAGTSAATAAYMNPLTAYNSSYNSSIFSNGTQNTITNYENDFLMPDFLKLNNCYSVQTQSANENPYAQVQDNTQTIAQESQIPEQASVTTPQAQSFQGNYEYSQQDIQRALEELEQQNQTQAKPAQPKLALKKKGFLAGLVTPIALGLYKVAKSGASLSSVFSKSNLIKSPIYAVVGLVAGSLLEGLLNKNAQQAA